MRLANPAIIWYKNFKGFLESSKGLMKFLMIWKICWRKDTERRFCFPSIFTMIVEVCVLNFCSMESFLSGLGVVREYMIILLSYEYISSEI